MLGYVPSNNLFFAAESQSANHIYGSPKKSIIAMFFFGASYSYTHLWITITVRSEWMHPADMTLTDPDMILKLTSSNPVTKWIINNN